MGKHPWGGASQAALGRGRGKQGATSSLSVTRKPSSGKVVCGQGALALPTCSSCLPATTDHDECQDMACENGECVNTKGSFHCFCSPPLTLDLSQQRCVNSTSSTGQRAWGSGAAGGIKPGLGGGAAGAHMLLCLCYQRTCLTTTSTWTSAGKKSPIMCAANPCMGTAPLTQNAAAKTARPGASSVLCALPGALVRGATCACMEGGEVPKMPSPCKGGFRKE